MNTAAPPNAPVRFFDRDLQVDTVKILPGQYYAATGPASISTVLGSCVAACLWDPRAGIGGMNHFMLPGDAAPAASPWAVSARFGVYAMEVLINEMIHLGADRRRLVAKAFGGARVLQGFGTLDVGRRNSEFVLAFLREERIQLASHDLQGVCPRKIHFFPATGKVQLKRLQLESNDALERQEREYLSRLAESGRGGEFDDFASPR